MERILEQIGVWAVLAILAVVVVAYSLWGAAIMRTQHSSGAFSQTKGSSLTTTL